MNMYKIRPLNDRTDYYIALEDIDYLKYVENNSRSLLAPLEDNYGHFEVYFKNSRLKQLSISEDQGKRLLNELEKLKR